MTERQVDCAGHGPRCTDAHQAEQLFLRLPGEPGEVLLLGAEIASLDGEDGFLSLGTCMQPALQPGDRLRVDAAPGPVCCGWIVVFPWQGHLLAHRVVRVRGSDFWARGDRCAEEEGPVSAVQLVGRVIGLERDGRFVGLNNKRPPGRFLGRLLAAVEGRLNDGPFARWLRLRGVDGSISPPLSALLSAVAGRMSSVVQVEIEKDPLRSVQSLLSVSKLTNSQQVQAVEDALAQRALYRLDAQFPGMGQIGNLHVLGLSDRAGGGVGLIAGLRLRPRGFMLGAGDALLHATETIARSHAWACLVHPIGERRAWLTGMLTGHGFKSVRRLPTAQKWPLSPWVLPEQRYLIKEFQ